MKRIKYLILHILRRIVCDCRGKMIGPVNPENESVFEVTCYYCGKKHTVRGWQWKTLWRDYHYFNLKVAQ